MLARIGTMLICFLLVACADTVNPTSAPISPAPDTSEVATAGPTPVARFDALPETVPGLPFDDNPDPNACGIPQPWGLDTPGHVTGTYDGEVIQPVVYLYDSHLRRRVVGQIPDGGRVMILLYQSNPVLDYYLVRSLDFDQPQEGWLPAPFLELERKT